MMAKVGMFIVAALLLAGCFALSASAAPAATAPPGYNQSEIDFSIAPGSYVIPATVPCSSGVVWGGGAGDLTPINGEAMVSSYPSGTSWFAQYDNRSSASKSGVVDVICAKKPAAYKHVFKGFDNPANAQTAATVTCPTGSVVFGGGIQSTADGFGSALLSLGPANKTTFRAVDFNGTGADQHLTLWAICGAQPPKYRIVAVPTSGSSNAFYTAATCPAGTSLIGGGVIQTGTANHAVFLAASTDAGQTWSGRILDPGAASVSLSTRAVCAA
jgi:hypothetical protein